MSGAERQCANLATPAVLDAQADPRRTVSGTFQRIDNLSQPFLMIGRKLLDDNRHPNPRMRGGDDANSTDFLAFRFEFETDFSVDWPRTECRHIKSTERDIAEVAPASAVRSVV